MATKKQSPVILACMLGIAGIAFYFLWDGAKKLENFVGSLPIQGAQTTVEAKIEGSEKATSLAVLYPLYVESKQKVERLPRAPDASTRAIDASFITSAVAADAAATPLNAVTMPLPKPVALPDYFPLLSQAMKVDAVMQNGAVLNGKFYAVGEPVYSFAYPSKKGHGTTVPQLAEIGAGFAVIKEAATEGTRTVTVKAPAQ